MPLKPTEVLRADTVSSRLQDAAMKLSLVQPGEI